MENKKLFAKILIPVFICAACILFIRIIPAYSVKGSPVIVGTYVCDKLPFVSMVFDLEDSYTFYYINYDDLEKGTYSKGTDKEHFINSAHFDNTKIIYEEENQTFTIALNGETYLFTRTNKLPSIPVETE